MPALSDSSAVREAERALPQHQTAVALLQRWLADPGIRVRWLDLACGKGQILGSLDENLSPSARARIEFWGFDANQDFVRETERLARSANFGRTTCLVGELSGFATALAGDGARFDFITATNVVHELRPVDIAPILVDCVLQLAETGTLFVCDVETISPRELGAVAWSRSDIAAVVNRMLDEFGASTYRPEFGLWHHRTSDWWGVQIEPRHMGNDLEAWRAKRADVIGAVRGEIRAQLRRRLDRCEKALSTLTDCAPETGAEEDYKVKLLFELWAVSYALRDMP